MVAAALSRTPMIGIGACCAFKRCDHIAAAIVAMHSRRVNLPGISIV
jgi:hypothetical protein